MMIGSFKLNDIESSSFDLVCKSVKRPLLPEAKVSRVELPGLSGVYDYPNEEYELREVIMRIMYIGKDYQELRTRARRIAAWLYTPTWSRLVIHDEPDLYYLCKITSSLELQHLWQSGTIDIVFDCQPFAYSIDEKQIILGPSGGVFNNEGTRHINFKSPYGSKSLITIEDPGPLVSITMNGNTLIYEGEGTGPLVIDNIEMEITRGGINVFDKLSGDIDTFLKIIPGENTVVADGVNGDIRINYIPMWL